MPDPSGGGDARRRPASFGRQGAGTCRRGVAANVAINDVWSAPPALRSSTHRIRFSAALEPEPFDRCPVLMLHPACDAWTPVRISDRFVDRLAAPRQRVLLEGCGHFPIEQPGLDQLRDALLAFLHRIGEVAARSTG